VHIFEPLTKKDSRPRTAPSKASDEDAASTSRVGAKRLDEFAPQLVFATEPRELLQHLHLHDAKVDFLPCYTFTYGTFSLTPKPEA
jgi:hypothetical protein